METLLVGNIGYWIEKNLREAFGEGRIVVIRGEGEFSEGGKKILYYSVPIADDRFEDLFMNYSFDRVVYASDFLTLHGNPQPEVENLRRLLRLCVKAKTEQFVFLSSLEICTSEPSGKTVILKAAEDLCRYYAEKYWLPIKVIRIPYLSSATLPKDYFYKLFARMEADGEAEIREDEKQGTCFIAMEDLAEFLFRLFDGWDGNAETLNLHPYTQSTFGDLEKGLKAVFPEGVIRRTNQSPFHTFELGEDLIRKRFGWFAKTEVIRSLPELYQSYRGVREQKLSRWKRFRERLLGLSRWKLMLELMGGGVLVEFMARLLAGGTQFNTIDVRLLFIVVMGTVYGMNAGVLAALFETLAVGFAYAAQGMNWKILFYEPSNWLPFILYFTTGAICGYVKYRNNDALNSLKKENGMLTDKFRFITLLYREALRSKGEYKKQIIGSRDSFGKIFEVVDHLSTVVPQEIFAESISVMENVLDNQSIAIYSVKSEASAFGRLEVYSRRMKHYLNRSIRLEEYEAAIRKVETEGVFINRDLLPGYPMYIAGVKRQERIVLLIMIYRVEYDQMGMYFANLFRIICGLIERSFLKALEYQDAVREKKYLGDTMIVRESYFMEQLSLYHNMAENGISTYALLQLLPEGRSDGELDELLRTRIRDTDLLGKSRDGNFYLLLSQIDNNSVEIVQNRLSALGLSCRQIQNLSEAEGGERWE